MNQYLLYSDQFYNGKKFFFIISSLKLYFINYNYLIRGYLNFHPCFLFLGILFDSFEPCEIKLIKIYIIK